MNVSFRYLTTYPLLLFSILVVIFYFNITTSIQINYSNPDFTIFQSGTTFISKTNSGKIIFIEKDPTEVIQKTIDLAKYGDTILLKSSIYNISKTLYGKSGIKILGEEGVVWNCTNLPDYGVALKLNGSESKTNMIFQQRNNDTKIIISNSSKLHNNDLLFLKSEQTWMNNPYNQKQGELNWIDSVNGNIISLRSPLKDNYYEGKFNIISPITNFTIELIKFQGEIGKNLYGISAEFGVNIKVNNCTFDSLESKAIEFDSCIDCKAMNNLLIKSDRNGLGYGIDVLYACENITLSNNTGIHCRHTISIGGGSDYGIPRNITIIQNKSYNSTDASFDSHQVGENVFIIKNYSEGGYQGISPKMYSGVVSGNIILNPGNVGITIFYAISNKNPIQIFNNTIENSGAYGILADHSINVLISNNTITNSSWAGILLNSSYNCTITSNLISSNGRVTIGYSNVEIVNSSSILIKQNKIIKGHNWIKPLYGILITSDSYNINLVNNDFSKDGGGSLGEIINNVPP